MTETAKGKTVTTYTLDFAYDAQGAPYSITVTLSRIAQTYYYITNLQGDVMYLLDTAGNTVAAYDYDPYGKIIGTNDYSLQTLDRQPTEPEDTTKTIAELNPLRYRGYYYDTDDLGFYYLQSRYYDADTCRFISADEYTDTDTDYLGYNMFAYCNNNPIFASDPDGRWLNIVIGAVVGGLVSGISAAIQGKDLDEVLVSAACGAVSGGLAATGLGGVAGQMLVGAATSAVDSGYQNYKEYKSGNITIGEAVFGTIVDTATGALFGAMGAEGKGAFKESCRITRAGIEGTKTLLAKGLHPTTKAVAKAAKHELIKYAKRELKSAIVDSAITTAVAWGTNKVSMLAYKDYAWRIKRGAL